MGHGQTPDNAIDYLRSKVGAYFQRQLDSDKWAEFAAQQAAKRRR
jgi:hypothetical protein